MNFPRKSLLNSNNPYQVLGLDEFVTQEDMKKEYRKLLLLWHPDRNPINAQDCAEMFIKVKWAYEILGDVTKRKMYDKFGTIDDETQIIDQGNVLNKFNEDLQEDLGHLRATNFNNAIKNGKRGTIKNLCDVCQGTGVTEQECGFFITNEVCKKCKGEGYVNATDYNDYVPRKKKGFNFAEFVFGGTEYYKEGG